MSAGPLSRVARLVAADHHHHLHLGGVGSQIEMHGITVCIRVRVSLWVPASGMLLLHGVRYAQTLRTAQSGRYASRFKK